MNQSDMIYMASDASWWFYSDETRTRAFGPYADNTEALAKFNEYLVYLQGLAVAAGDPGPTDTTRVDSPTDEISKVVAEFVRNRDLKAEITKRHKEELAEVEQELKTGENWLLDKMTGLGLESIKVPGGTVYTQSRMFAGIGDKGALMEYIRANGEPELLAARISSDVLKVWMEAHGGHCPPGVTASYERVVTVRRS